MFSVGEVFEATHMPDPMARALSRLDEVLTERLNWHRENGTDAVTRVKLRSDVLDIALEARRDGDVLAVYALTAALRNEVSA